MTDHLDDHDDEFLTVAATAVRQSGAAALDALGWWELLVDLDEPTSRRAVFALFRAQGRELASTPALGALMAAPILEQAGRPPGSAVAAIAHRSARRGPTRVVIGDPAGRDVVLADPDAEARIVPADGVEVVPVDVPGGVIVHEVTVDPARGTVLDVDASARGLAVRLGRLAAAQEMLGAAERAVEIAVEHARDREQFGQPIGTFQAVRHLLAWARTDCVAVDAATATAVDLLDRLPPHLDEVVKALAGRNARRACERSLQVLGGIGFTAEHAHHHHHSRVLLLDALLGSSNELVRDLGTWLRTSGTMPGYPAALLGTDTATGSPDR